MTNRLSKLSGLASALHCVWEVGTGYKDFLEKKAAVIVKSHLELPGQFFISLIT